MNTSLRRALYIQIVRFSMEHRVFSSLQLGDWDVPPCTRWHISTSPNLISRVYRNQNQWSSFWSSSVRMTTVRGGTTHGNIWRSLILVSVTPWYQIWWGWDVPPCTARCNDGPEFNPGMENWRHGVIDGHGVVVAHVLKQALNLQSCKHRRPGRMFEWHSFLGAPAQGYLFLFGSTSRY